MSLGATTRVCPPRVACLARAVWDTSVCVGAWRSLVARAVRVGEVPGSNPGAPIGSCCAKVSEYGRIPPKRLRLAGQCSRHFVDARRTLGRRGTAESALRSVLRSCSDAGTATGTRPAAPASLVLKLGCGADWVQLAGALGARVPSGSIRAASALARAAGPQATSETSLSSTRRAGGARGGCEWATVPTCRRIKAR